MPAAATNGGPHRADAILQARLLDGERAALAEIFTRHGRAVFNVALRVSQSRTIAEDVCQDVFHRAWYRPSKFDPERGSLQSWLCMDARGLAITAVRSQAAARKRDHRYVASDLGAAAAQPVEDDVLARERSERIATALAQIPLEERRAIETAYFGGMSYRAAAAHIGIPEGTAKSQIRQGLSRLAALLRDDIEPSPVPARAGVDGSLRNGTRAAHAPALTLQEQ